MLIGRDVELFEVRARAKDHFMRCIYDLRTVAEVENHFRFHDLGPISEIIAPREVVTAMLADAQAAKAVYLQSCEKIADVDAVMNGFRQAMRDEEITR